MVSGRAMCRHLVSSGVAVQKVVRKRETGYYVADFFIPEMDKAIPPADVWAEQIRHVLPTAHILDTHDMIASWRTEQPVIYATVVFLWSEQDVV